MKLDYSFLKDELAIGEIRKHKWIESQKSGQEIGFASAAVDWIRRYGQQWLIFRLDRQDENDLFVEKRNYRRVQSRLPVQIKYAQDRFISHTKDINLIGLSCLSAQRHNPHDKVKVTLYLRHKQRLKEPARFTFETRVQSIRTVHAIDKQKYYKLFLPFSEGVRNFLRLNPQTLLHTSE
jgi:hypothetical protein